MNDCRVRKTAKERLDRLRLGDTRKGGLIPIFMYNSCVLDEAFEAIHKNLRRSNHAKREKR